MDRKKTAGNTYNKNSFGKNIFSLKKNLRENFQKIKFIEKTKFSKKKIVVKVQET